jgi:hypothetical protein
MYMHTYTKLKYWITLVKAGRFTRKGTRLHTKRPHFICCQICTVCEHAMKVEANVFLELKEREYAFDADGGDYDGAGADDGGDNNGWW